VVPPPAMRYLPAFTFVNTNPGVDTEISRAQRASVLVTSWFGKRDGTRIWRSTVF